MLEEAPSSMITLYLPVSISCHFASLTIHSTRWNYSILSITKVRGLVNAQQSFVSVVIGSLELNRDMFYQCIIKTRFKFSRVN
jgi:hypothetical protein